MNLEDYKLLAAEDFVLNDAFRKLVKGDTVNGITIEDLRNRLPEKNREISLAIEILNGIVTLKNDQPHEKKAELLKRIFEHRRKQVRFSVLRIAASVLIVVGLGISALFFVQRSSDIENFASANSINSEKAELILADGQRVEINSKQSNIEYVAGGSTLSLNDSSILEQQEPVDGKSFNQVIVPLGKRSNVLLSDGTRVWLNSGSRLVYSPIFKGKSREVFLEGEAFFEVSFDINKPFFVRTDVCRVKVLGTKFLVRSFTNENEFNTVLIEGKVSLATNSKMFTKEVELSPNQMAELSGSTDNFRISEVKNVENYITWIYGYIDFQDEDIVSLTNRISRYYNVVIEVRLSNVRTKFSGKLDLKEDPERILSGLSIITKTKFEKQGNKYVIYE